jgi:cytochrome c-type biogenesis protein CcmF
MELWGNLACILAALICGLSVALAGEARHATHDSAPWAKWACQAITAVAWLLWSALGAYLIALLAGDYQIRAVQQSSSRAVELRYTISLMWVGLRSSLLFWAALQSAVAALVAHTLQRKAPHLLPTSTIVFGLLLLFDIALVILRHNPFDPYLVESPVMGTTMSPMLRNPWMLIHPPVQYLGYVLCAAPLAVTIAALVDGRLDRRWFTLCRTYAIWCWVFLGLGMVLGMVWAYEAVDWGGYWSWDPVENASLMPFLSATALLHTFRLDGGAAHRHSNGAAPGRRRFADSTLAFVFATFWLTVLGTFFTRTGVLQSIHSFGHDPFLSWAFAGFLIVGISATMVCWIKGRKRQSDLQAQTTTPPEKRPPSSMFRPPRRPNKRLALGVGNLILAVTTLFVLVATVLPGGWALFFDRRLHLTADHFEIWIVPGGLALALVLGVGQILGWRNPLDRQSASNRRIRWLGVLPATFALGGLAAGLTASLALPRLATNGWQIAGVALAGLVIGGALGTLICARWSATSRRATAAAVAHLGVGLALLGFCGRCAARQADVHLAPGQSAQLAGNVFTLLDTRLTRNLISQTLRAEIDVHSTPPAPNSEPVPAADPARAHKNTLRPAFTQYPDRPTMAVTDAALARGLRYDIQARLLAREADGTSHLQLIVHPLVSWIWIGFILMAAAGTWLGLQSLCRFSGRRNAAHTKDSSRRRCKHYVPLGLGALCWAMMTGGAAAVLIARPLCWIGVGLIGICGLFVLGAALSVAALVVRGAQWLQQMRRARPAPHMLLLVGGLAALWATPGAAVSDNRPRPPPTSPDPIPMQMMVGRPLADPSLPNSTVAVRVAQSSPASAASPSSNVHLTGHAGVQIELVSVEPAPQGSPPLPSPLAQAVTHANGRVQLDARQFADIKVQVIVRLAAGPRTSAPFRIPTHGGVRMLFVPDKTAPMESVQSHFARSPATTDPTGLRVAVEYRIQAIEEHQIALTILYSLQNSADRPLQLPPTGLLLPHPHGVRFAHLTGRPPNGKVESAGLRIDGRLPPGAHPFTLSAVLPYSGSTARLRHLIPLALDGYLVVHPQHHDVQIIGPKVRRVAMTSAHTTAQTDAPIVWRGPAAPADSTHSTIRFNINGLPTRSRWPAWGAVVGGLLLALCGLTRTWRHTARRRASQRQRPPSSCKSDGQQ